MKKQLVALLVFLVLGGSVFAQQIRFQKQIVGTWDITAKRDLLPDTVTFNSDYSGLMVFVRSKNNIEIPFEWSKNGQQIPLKYNKAVTPSFTISFAVSNGTLYGEANFDGGGGYETQYLRAKQK